MDKVILDQDRWLYLTDQGAAPINYADLPYRFILLLNPPLYLCHNGQEKVMWSPFQEQALSELQQSQHQIISSYYMGQFANGQPNGEILQIQGVGSIACVKRRCSKQRTAMRCRKSRSILKDLISTLRPKSLPLKS
ncbi:hypothetical protein [Candidatus Odyssella thessalonicensis]|uniref:hypothetical protein n=1 Tax=Candidatus Odyssella thessalonicensis TaxID=84647 RepID=UPI000225AEF0|nr:hypothetical protein [Candidatus Odyssella thessalonicensis]